MDKHYWNLNVGKLVKQKNIFLLFSVVLCGSTILLSILLFSKEEKVIVMPTQAPSFWIQNRTVSQKYLENMGTFLADLILNRSPADAESKNKTVLEHVHPGFFHEICKQLDLDAKHLTSQVQSFVFQTEKAYANTASLTFVVEGESLVFVGKQGTTPVCAQMLKRRYTLGFKCENYKLLLVSLKKEEI